MSDRKLAQKLQPLLKQVWKLSRRLTKAMMNWLLRTVFLLNRRPRVAGFVLPTTVFLILVVSLTVGALTFRSFNSTTRTIGNVQSRQIYNAATPAIDRARAKLDYLFAKDNRLPSGIPAEEVVISMLLNDGRPVGSGGVFRTKTVGADPYTFLTDTADTSIEERIDINGDGLLDNAWIYTDKNTNSSVIYSITLSTPDLVANDPTKLGPLDLLGMPDTTKAKGDEAGPYARNGPLSNSEAVSCRVAGGGSTVEGGWYQDQTNTSILRKRFQVDAFVVSNDTVNKGRPTNFTTLEFAQDRKLDRGNKWGAWFKYDLEITSGSKLNWNGAMHSEGSILIGRDNTTTAYLISSPSSCLFRPASNSEISVRQFDEQKEPDGTPANKFFGIIGAGDIKPNNFSGSSEIHTYDGLKFSVPADKFTSTTDWTTGGKGTLSALTTDPKALLTRDIHQAITPDITNQSERLSEPNIATNLYAKQERFFVTKTNTQPYVDDTYRADNRYGPKVRYKNEVIPPNTFVGTDIPVGEVALVNDVATASTEVGLDGYWERRTFKDSDLSSSKVYTGGMRILVGERLELGNPYGWVAPENRPDTKPATGYLANTGAYPVGTGAETGDVSQLRKNDYTAPTTISDVESRQSDVEGDPLNPPYKYPNTDRAHEAKQRRALRDNPAAVQSAAIYHYSLGETADGRTPAACLALTAHPGSPYTLRQSVNFSSSKVTGSAAPLVDFFSGKGTNGWEFIPPTVAQLASGGGINKALVNLANFAGDPDGAFPPKQEAGKIHPDPILTMWGNFSNLRRALTPGNGSPADQSYLQTAGCTMGMLAYNIDRIQNFDPTVATTPNRLNTLGQLLFPMLNGNVDDPQGEVLSKADLATYGYDKNGSYNYLNYNARDYDRVTPEMVLAALKTYLVKIGIPEPEEDVRYQLATLIHEHFQIRRDRTYGFRPSPAVNTWNYNPYALQMGFKDSNPTGNTTFKVTLWSSACDPNSFKVGASNVGAAGVSTLSLASGGAEAQRRLALSRLCGTIIPPGAVHDDAPAGTALDIRGDNNYPARKGTSPNVPALEDGDDSQRPIAGQKPSTTNPYFDSTNATDGAALNTAANSDEALKRAQVLPKFPSLYYIFPEVSHDYIGATIPAPANLDHRQPGNSAIDSTLAVAFQPWKEPYVTAAQSYPAATFDPISTAAGTGNSAADPGYDVAVPTGNLTGSGMTAFQYRAMPTFQIADTSVADAALQPRTSIADWVLPTNATTNNPNRVIAPDGTVAVVPFQDKVAFNGREWLPSRVLDVDLDMLRTASIGDDTWLPVSGIVYAFREDAVREDGIARPDGGLAYTNAQDPGAETDPLKDPKFGVAVKAVDFIPDPDRRPHGFRLRNGAILKREGTVPDADNFRGISFITDQPAYIMGNFNLHQATPNDPKRLEEFTQQLPDKPADYTNDKFYTERTIRDPRFADPSKDLWRPSEVLADAVIMLSDQFCDGSAIDTFMTAGSTTPGSRLGIGATTSSGNATIGIATTKDVYTYKNPAGTTKQGGEVYNDDGGLFAPGCQNDATNGATSFLNQNRPKESLKNNWNWARENPSDPFYSPVKISRNGNGLIVNNATGIPSPTDVPIEYSSANDTDVKGTYFTVNDNNNRERALQFRDTEETKVNAILISNIIPSRANQQNGALNNFPRFLEDWNDSKATLRFAGSFLQLGFSNYATAPFDQDRWEPTGTTIAPSPTKEDEYTSFFRPPARLWGYDVALQLAQASPAATRFTSPSSEKNEFYTEPAANDPYMQNLCKALKANAPTGLTAANLNCPT